MRWAVERRRSIVIGAVECILQFGVLCAAVPGHLANDGSREAGRCRRVARGNVIVYAVVGDQCAVAVVVKVIVIGGQLVGVVEQRLTGRNVFAAIPVQAHALFHRFDFIARSIDEVSPATQLLLVDFEFAQIFLYDRCYGG